MIGTLAVCLLTLAMLSEGFVAARPLLLIKVLLGSGEPDQNEVQEMTVVDSQLFQKGGMSVAETDIGHVCLQ